MTILYDIYIYHILFYIIHIYTSLYKKWELNMEINWKG